MSCSHVDESQIVEFAFFCHAQTYMCWTWPLVIKNNASYIKYSRDCSFGRSQSMRFPLYFNIREVHTINLQQHIRLSASFNSCAKPVTTWAHKQVRFVQVWVDFSQAQWLEVWSRALTWYLLTPQQSASSTQRVYSQPYKAARSEIYLNTKLLIFE